MFRLLRFFLIHHLLGWQFRTAFRVDARGWAHLPKRGGALVVANHLGYLDCLLLAATCPRPLRFLGSLEMMRRHRWLAWIYRFCGVIPTDPHRARTVVKDATAALRAGEVVCLFPEGQISRDGTLQPLQRGVEVIARQAQAPVVPVRINLPPGTRWSGLLGPWANGLPLLRHPGDSALHVSRPLEAGELSRATLTRYLGAA